ncbi:MAG: uracil-DNA glycosylase [Rickettsiales bacterium]|jgi:DNA polymerase|nr:uracil-DNA glycosylase [Rickettsiales bacterium]
MQEKRKILKSLQLAGVEWELQDAPHSPVRFAAAASRSAIAEPKIFVAPMAHVVKSNAGIMEIAKELSKSSDMVEAIKSFKEHPLFSGAKNTVVPVVASAAKLVVIIDMPSVSDDNSGLILSGEEGALFDKMIGAIGIHRAECSIAPLVFWRPAGGRTPTKEELAFCRPFIDRMIDNAPGAKILTLGALAAKEIIGAVLPRDHGKAFDNKIPIYKPDFIIQNPSVKKDVWEVLKKL